MLPRTHSHTSYIVLRLGLRAGRGAAALGRVFGVLFHQLQTGGLGNLAGHGNDHPRTTNALRESKRGRFIRLKGTFVWGQKRQENTEKEKIKSDRVLQLFTEFCCVSVYPAVTVPPPRHCQRGVWVCLHSLPESRLLWKPTQIKSPPHTRSNTHHPHHLHCQSLQLPQRQIHAPAFNFGKNSVTKRRHSEGWVFTLQLWHRNTKNKNNRQKPPCDVCEVLLCEDFLLFVVIYDNKWSLSGFQTDERTIWKHQLQLQLKIYMCLVPGYDLMSIFSPLTHLLFCCIAKQWSQTTVLNMDQKNVWWCLCLSWSRTCADKQQLIQQTVLTCG